MTARTVWAGEKLERLKREFPRGDVAALAKSFGITEKALRQAAGRAGIARDREMVLRSYAERGTAHLAAWRATVKAQPKPVRVERHPLEEVMTSWMR